MHKADNINGMRRADLTITLSEAMPTAPNELGYRHRDRHGGSVATLQKTSWRPTFPGPENIRVFKGSAMGLPRRSMAYTKGPLAVQSENCQYSSDEAAIAVVEGRGGNEVS